MGEVVEKQPTLNFIELLFFFCVVLFACFDLSHAKARPKDRFIPNGLYGFKPLCWRSSKAWRRWYDNNNDK